MPGSGRRRTGAPRRLRGAAARGDPSRDEQQCRGVGADPVEGQQAGGMCPDEGDDEFTEALRLGAGELRAPSQLAQRDADGVPQRCCRAGTQRCQLGHQGSCGVLGEAGSQVIGPGHDQGLAWLIVWVRSPVAPRLATISARTASTVPSRPLGAPRARPDWAARAALTAPGSQVSEIFRTTEQSPRGAYRSKVQQRAVMECGEAGHLAPIPADRCRRGSGAVGRSDVIDRFGVLPTTASRRSQDLVDL
jgi:hypothetical protein